MNISLDGKDSINDVKLNLLKPLLDYLASRSDVCNLNLEVNPPQTFTANDWEQANNLMLPEDVKTFYKICDGFHLSWKYKLNDSTYIPVCDCRINSISKLNKLTISSKYNNCFDIKEIYIAQKDEENIMKFTDKKLFFELDCCGGYSKVCLVFNKPDYKTDSISEPQCSVWFIDRSLGLHYLSDSFSSYIHLMMGHAAVKEWQYAFTDIGLTLQTRQWLMLICPIRLKIGEGFNLVDNVKRTNRQLIKFRADKVFNNFADKRAETINSLSKNKKKPIIPSNSISKLNKKIT